LPDGTAVGKITAYEFGVDGDSGAEGGFITIACFAGKDSTLVETEGMPTYAAASYVGPDYQVYENRTVLAPSLNMVFSPPASDPIDPATVGLTSVTVSGGETEQAAVLSSRYIDIAAAVDALNEVATTVDLIMTPLDTSPRETVYYNSEVRLSVPLGIDLGVA
jgi:hypothetical protein